MKNFEYWFLRPFSRPVRTWLNMEKLKVIAGTVPVIMLKHGLIEPLSNDLKALSICNISPSMKKRGWTGGLNDPSNVGTSPIIRKHYEVLSRLKRPWPTRLETTGPGGNPSRRPVD
jgi:hypothetical protein